MIHLLWWSHDDDDADEDNDHDNDNNNKSKWHDIVYGTAIMRSLI